MTIGGNTVTRLRDVLPQSPLFQYFDSAVAYEGETAFVQLVSAVGAKRSLSRCDAYIRTKPGLIRPRRAMRSMAMLPPRSSTVCRSPLRPTKILPYLATRAAAGAAESATMARAARLATRSKKIQDVLAEITHLRDKYGARHFHFTISRPLPALFRKLARRPGRKPDGHHLDDAHAI